VDEKEIRVQARKQGMKPNLNGPPEFRRRSFSRTACRVTESRGNRNAVRNKRQRRWSSTRCAPPGALSFTKIGLGALFRASARPLPAFQPTGRSPSYSRQPAVRCMVASGTPHQGQIPLQAYSLISLRAARSTQAGTVSFVGVGDVRSESSRGVTKPFQALQQVQGTKRA